MNKTTYLNTHVQSSTQHYSLTGRLKTFLTLVPPIFLILTPINAASAAALSLQGFPPWHKAVIGFIAVALAGWGINAFNHYMDRDRDRIIWPHRAIPTGKVKAGNVLSVAIISLVAAPAITWFVFNQTTFFILLLAIILGTAYSVVLRDKIGYLCLPPIVGLIYLGGWVAFSPDTLFTSSVPWYLYLLGVVWQTAHISVYYPSHIIFGTEGKMGTNTAPFFLTRPSPHQAAIIGLIFTSLIIVMAILLPLLAPLGYVYIAMILAAAAYTLTRCLLLLRGPSNLEKEMKAFISLSIFRMSISVAILIEATVRWLE